MLGSLKDSSRSFRPGPAGSSLIWHQVIYIVHVHAPELSLQFPIRLSSAGPLPGSLVG